MRHLNASSVFTIRNMLKNVLQRRRGGTMLEHSQERRSSSPTGRICPDSKKLMFTLVGQWYHLGDRVKGGGSKGEERIGVPAYLCDLQLRAKDVSAHTI